MVLFNRFRKISPRINNLRVVNAIGYAEVSGIAETTALHNQNTFLQKHFDEFHIIVNQAFHEKIECPFRFGKLISGFSSTVTQQVTFLFVNFHVHCCVPQFDDNPLLQRGCMHKAENSLFIFLIRTSF
jgi:hypothetical protein